MNFLIIFMMIWLGSIPVALAKSEPPQPVIVQVDYAYPCYDAPCSETCMHGISESERYLCHNDECRHYDAFWKTSWTGRCGRVSGADSDRDDDINFINNCNGFKRKVLECKIEQ